jgi:ABC-type multidrug transport system ATPase subunit
MNEAMFCDRLAILHEGVLLADEPPRQLLWKQKAKIKICLENQIEEKVVSNYPQQLPQILQQYGLETDISRIEIEEETLETVVLSLINDHEKQIIQGEEQ